MPNSRFVVTQQQQPYVSRQSNAVTGVLAVLLLLVAGALVFTVYEQRKGSRETVNFEPRAITPAQDLGADEKQTIQVFQNDAPSVVHITSIQVRTDQLSMNEMEIPAGVGSGFIWDAQGHIVTNFHVVEDAARAQVILSDGSAYAAQIIGRAPDKDLAVLKIDAPPSKLRPLPIGTSANLVVGQKVLAIGNPFGLDQTLTTGVVSGLGREIKSVTQHAIHDVVQTDAPINPGNSGGPLLDSSGRLIGVNTAIYSPSGASAGIGFAIPVDTVNRIVPQLIQNGKIERPGLGINIATDQAAYRLKVDGVLIIEVAPDGAAAKAGIVGTQPAADGSWRLGDVIVGLDGQAVHKQQDLFKVLDDHKVGDRMKVTLMRDGEKRDVDVTLQSLDQ
ncbi:MAG TPA: trypsin-like peptidase domain-containing protein [Kofleriaceae bacterium]|nr:trypsin-like peptidase domain-containing protein [Kofleriaceae bacterium]